MKAPVASSAVQKGLGDYETTHIQQPVMAALMSVDDGWGWSSDRAFEMSQRKIKSPALYVEGRRCDRDRVNEKEDLKGALFLCSKPDNP
jgi:hypothetical protein